MIESRRAFVFWSLAWLPLGVMAVSFLRGIFGGMQVESLVATLVSLPMALLSLVFVAPCGLPLALAWRQIQRMGESTAAWTSFAILAPVTAFASLFAGLLGPVAIAVYAAVLSLPAWALYGILRWRRQLARNATSRLDSDTEGKS